MVIGAPDVGKSTLAEHLYQRLAARSQRIAFLDGDPGQSRLGPPTTLTLATGMAGEPSFPPHGQHWQSFVGEVSPRGHMLPLVVGAARLARAGRAAGVETIVYDTCGLVDPNAGGVHLKLAKIDLLRPAAVVALQRDRELEPLLIPLRQSRRTRLIELPLSPAVQPRSQAARQAYRAARFAEYFASARPLTLVWTRFAVLPQLGFGPQRLVALEDARGFVKGLGIVTQVEPKTRQVTLYTPLVSLAEVDTIRLGDLALYPVTFQERHL